jgi:hypothetical protein
MVFEGCTSLTSVTIGSGFTGGGLHPFEFATSLTEIKVSAGNPNYISDQGVVYNKTKTTIERYPTGRTGAFTIPDGVTRVHTPLLSIAL